MRDVGGWTQALDLDPTAYVAPGAVVVGDVRLGARSSVWFHAVLRGDNDVVRVGEDTNLQDQCMVHVDEGQPALIGARVTVGHRAILHGCVIEDDCLIGMGAIVLSGARVGRGSLVAAGALVREGQTIPPGSLALGAPARVAGPVAPAHVEAIRRGAVHYVELARSYHERGITAGFQDAAWLPGGRAPLSPLDWDLAVQALASIAGWARARVAGVAAIEARDPSAPEAAAARALIQDLSAQDERRHRMLDRHARGPGEAAAPAAPDSGRPLEAAFAEWVAARDHLVQRLAAIGAEESLAGPTPLASVVRSWAEEDLARRFPPGARPS